ncbi:DUF4872 domain-containing protein [Brevibacterium sp.]|uniref:DUF4872 domain-containing protein n=1 Tax=Brevibacterium sp. TaxID=1701 RepID=UPI0028118F83|nr:DUF4872 domain-containing protein [Brevibacterium sp.]
MVQNKHFKSLVRERMKKTGERYTTARLRIMAARPTPAPEPGLLPGYPALPIGADSSTAQYDAALWHRILAQAGVENPLTGEPFSPAMLAGLGGGIGFMFATFSYQELTTATVVLRAHPEAYTDRMLDRSGVALDRTGTTGAKAAADALDSALEAGRACVVRVTHGALPWISSDGPLYQESIDIAVVGRDGDDRLVDGGGWSPGEDDADRLRRLKRTELAEARRRRRADRHWAVSIATEPGGHGIEQLAEQVRIAIAETTGRLLGTLPLEGIPSSWLPKFGVQGMRTWAGLLRDERSKRGWSTLFADQRRLREGLEMVQLTAGGNRWGGPGGLRGLYADFLTEAAELPGLGTLEQSAASYRRLAPLWDGLIDESNPDVTAEGRCAHFARLADRLDELADLEARAARELAEAAAD